MRLLKQAATLLAVLPRLLLLPAWMVASAQVLAVAMLVPWAMPWSAGAPSQIAVLLQVLDAPVARAHVATAPAVAATASNHWMQCYLRLVVAAAASTWLMQGQLRQIAAAPATCIHLARLRL